MILKASECVWLVAIRPQNYTKMQSFKHLFQTRQSLFCHQAHVTCLQTFQHVSMDADIRAKRFVILQKQRSDPFTDQSAVNITAQPNMVQQIYT